MDERKAYKCTCALADNPDEQAVVVISHHGQHARSVAKHHFRYTRFGPHNWKGRWVEFDDIRTTRIPEYDGQMPYMKDGRQVPVALESLNGEMHPGDQP